MSSRRSQIAPFHVMEVMRQAQEHESAGNEVLHLEVGQPGTPAPAGARAAAIAAIGTATLGYTAALGTPELRARIARWYDERHQLAVDPGCVVVTTGASGSCVLAFLALWDPGDRVAVIEPGYPCYRNDLEALGIDVVGLPVDIADQCKPTIEQLDALLPLDGLVLASPSNPTGTVLADHELQALARWADVNEVRLVVDEIYHGITFDRPATTALAHSANVVVFNSFSKYFSMTGWRLGWIVAPLDLIAPLERLAQNLSICAPSVSQVAGLAAFDDLAELDANVAVYAENRRIMLEGLANAGFDELAPADGAFYVWASIRHLGMDAVDLCQQWLRELDIAVTPGIDFDPRRGHDFVRFSYAGSTAHITEAMHRLGRWHAAREESAS
ncbi:MAG: aminotransferase class I/II-fold pyridoxal phosphate-dependent enzyme [Acidimicrobiales bacterium]